MQNLLALLHANITNQVYIKNSTFSLSRLVYSEALSAKFRRWDGKSWSQSLPTSLTPLLNWFSVSCFSPANSNARFLTFNVVKPF